MEITRIIFNAPKLFGQILTKDFTSITALFVAMVFPLLLNADTSDLVLPTIFDQFKQEKVLQAELEIDFDHLESKRRTNDYLSAHFSYVNALGITQDWAVEVRARGRFRRNTCEMPPLRLRFSKKELIHKGYQKHNSFKLVTHCMEGKEGDELIMREYLAYQMYNVLTEKSFRTQLVKITYKDSQSKAKKTQYGVLIEDTDLMEDRLDGYECEECYGLKTAAFEKDNLYLHALFQYMIGNTDWSTRMISNLKLVASNKTGKVVVLPYDFDFSGLVNAKYAIPNSNYKLKSLRERYFQLEVDDKPLFYETVNYIKGKEQILLGTIENFELLSQKDRKDILEYLGAFFEELENPNRILNKEQGISK